MGMMNGYNTNHRIVWWLLGFFALIVIGGTGAWIRAIQAKVNNIAEVQGVRGERISALETVLPHIKERLDSIDRKLEKMEERQRR